MKNRFFLLLLFLLTTQLTFAQVRNCHSADYLQEQIQNDPNRATQMTEIEKHTAQVIANQTEVNGIITIPVVVHIVYNTAQQNISNAQIQSQIDVLNEDFRRLNSDKTNNWAQAADSEIEFCMATVDPNGNTTNGITRTQTNVTSFGTNDNMKFNSSGGKDAWNTAHYLNIWVCNIGGGILGYAQFPGGPANTDGVVVGYQYFGTMGTATAPFNLGRTGTHEVGHYLNLYHIWGDGGCGVDDQVADTPASDAPNYGCPSGHTSCGSADMIENYMDYTDDGCMNLYTQGQKSRMRALFEAGGARESLLTSNGCGGGNPTCDTPNGLASSNVGNNGATISWSAVSSAQSYNVQYRPSGNSSWTTQNVSGTSYNLTGLNTCTNYEARVQTDCGSNTSAYSSVTSFTTTGCTTPCNTPSGLTVSGISNNDATSSWGAVSGAVSYTLQHRVAGTSSWTSQTVSTTSATLANLSSCTDYQVRVRTNCANNNSSYSSIENFQTTGCSSGCNDNEATLTIVPDDYGSETTWEITSGNTVLYSGGPYTNGNTTPVVVDLCLPDGCYDFTINDSYGDGICCAWGQGSYLIEAGGNVLISGGQFGSTETKNFCFGGGNTPTGDAGITNINRPKNNNCGTSFQPRVKVKNFDTAPLTSVTINYNVDGGANQTFNWTGNIAPGATKNVNLPVTTATVGAHTFNAATSSPNGGADANPNNDSKSKNFTTTAGEAFKIQIKPDDYGSETTWTLEDDNGNIVAQGGPYPNNNNSVKTKWVCLQNGCYTFTIYDSYGDGICCAYGNGWYRIRDVNNQNIINGNGQFGSFEQQTFCIGGNQRSTSIETDEPLNVGMKVYPNPTNGQVNVTIENARPNSQIQIFNALGQVVRAIEIEAGDATQSMDLSELEGGLYFVKLNDGKKEVTQKLMILPRK